MLGLGQALDTPLAGRAYKAIRPRSPAEAKLAAARFGLPEPGLRPAFLIDTYQPGQPGGTGQAGDWQTACDLARAYPLLLAGGLTPDNVAQAVQTVRPWGVDVSSGVEAAPGCKDPAAIRAFIQDAKAA